MDHPFFDYKDFDASGHDPSLPRCGWVPPHDAFYCAYHDKEWGRPITDDKALFSKLIQDGMQAGLAWITILRNGSCVDYDFAKAREYPCRLRWARP